jgi:hypothetical protein
VQEVARALSLDPDETRPLVLLVKVLPATPVRQARRGGLDPLLAAQPFPI